MSWKMEGEKIMKKNKLFTLFPLLLSVSLFLVGCGDKIEETLTEKVIEQGTDGEIDIDSKDGEVSFGTEDGSLTTGENLEWPKESMGSLPEPDATFLSITDLKEEDATSVILTFDKNDGGSDYMEELIDLGYVQRSFTKTETNIMYMAVKEDNTSIILNYDTVEGNGSITLSRNNDSAKEFFENEMTEDEQPVEINMDESMDWPKDSMDNIPPINALITSVSQDSNRVSIGFKGIAEQDMISYIDEIQSLGFDAKVTEMVMDDLLTYTASNQKEDMISVNWSSNEGSITYTKQ